MTDTTTTTTTTTEPAAPTVHVAYFEHGADYADLDPFAVVATTREEAARRIAAAVHAFLTDVEYNPYAERFLEELGAPADADAAVWVEEFNMDDAPGTVLFFTAPVWGAQ